MAMVPEDGGTIAAFDARPSATARGGTYFEEGDFLLARITPCFENGKQGIVRGVPGGWGLGSTELFAMRSEVVSSDYLAQLFRSASVRAQLRTEMQGASGRMRLPRRAVENLVVAIPPLDEQGRITEDLDRLFALIDAGERALGEAAKLVDSYVRSLLVAGLSGRLTAASASGGDGLLEDILRTRETAARAIGARVQVPRPPVRVPDLELPAGWTWASIDQLALKVQYGTSAKTHGYGEDGDVPVLRMGNVNGGRINWGSLKYLPADHEGVSAVLLNEGDILFNRTNSADLVGKTALVEELPGRVAFASYLIRVVLHPSVEPAWVNYWLNSPFGRHWARANANQQVGQANISGSKLRELAIPLPPSDCQRAICRALQDRIGEAHLMRQQLALSVAESQQLRQAALQRLLTGAQRSDRSVPAPRREPVYA
ncbi:MAG TPA: restriction endonuclease subunit S [Thermoleophilaceae bacterium]